jgi:hypothetical protein
MPPWYVLQGGIVEASKAAEADEAAQQSVVKAGKAAEADEAAQQNVAKAGMSAQQGIAEADVSMQLSPTRRRSNA